MAKTETVVIDAKGRVTIPKSICKREGLKAGDTLAVESRNGGLRLVKQVNMWDVLAEDALAEFRAGRTRELREIAAERGIVLGE